MLWRDCNAALTPSLAAAAARLWLSQPERFCLPLEYQQNYLFMLSLYLTASWWMRAAMDT